MMMIVERSITAIVVVVVDVVDVVVIAAVAMLLMRQWRWIFSFCQRYRCWHWFWRLR